MKKLLVLLMALAFGMSVMGLSVASFASSSSRVTNTQAPAKVKKQHKHFKSGKKNNTTKTLTAN